MKKLLTMIILVLSFGIGSSVFAATNSVSPPFAVGNYNDFGNQIRLDVYVKNTNATKYKIYWTSGYASKSGFQSKYVPATVNYMDSKNQEAVRTGLIVPSQGWWTIMVVSVGANGTTSKAFVTNVYVIR